MDDEREGKEEEEKEEKERKKKKKRKEGGVYPCPGTTDFFTRV